MDSFNLLGWNVRRLNNAEKQREVFEHCKINKVGFGALFETKIHHDRVSKLMSNNPNWKIHSSQEISFRILLIWIDKLVKVDILMEDRQLIHCKLKMVGYKEEFFLIAVYGSNSLNERKDLWNKLTSIGRLNAPWIILGDFNAMFAYKDRSGGREIRGLQR
uniref:Endonuclease/exonuclease/phosphatase domain-containing protein n=1 Tax=Cannabis sativa TaxID=3483 RepID=A0A803PSI8_CANSA